MEDVCYPKQFSNYLEYLLCFVMIALHRSSSVISSLINSIPWSFNWNFTLLTRSSICWKWLKKELWVKIQKMETRKWRNSVKVAWKFHFRVSNFSWKCYCGKSEVPGLHKDFNEYLKVFEKWVKEIHSLALTKKANEIKFSSLNPWIPEVCFRQARKIGKRQTRKRKIY